MFIYLDNAATTRVSDAALDAMLPYFGVYQLDNGDDN